MAERCSWADRVIAEADSVEEEVVRHLEVCAGCRAERRAHREIVAAFRETARPALSPHFRRQLLTRLEEERRRERIARRGLVTLRLYWLFAAVVCAAVVAHLNSSLSSASYQMPFLLAIAVFVAPIAVVLIAIRANPMELIFLTLTGGMGERVPRSDYSEPV